MGLNGIGKKLPQTAIIMVSTARRRIIDGSSDYSSLTRKEAWNTIWV
jgi:hypothetical protein